MKRTWKTVVWVLLAALLMACMSYMTIFAADETKFVPGTSVNGVGIGGMTVEEAKTQIENFYAGSYQLTITKKGGATESIKGSDIGYKVVVPEGLQAILDAENAAGRASGPDADNKHRMDMSVAYDEAALAAKIQGLSCISGSGIVTTSDAHISAYEAGKAFTIIPEVQGNNVDVEKTTSAIRNAVATGATSVSLEEQGCYYTVNVTSTQTELVQLCNVMNQCKDMTVTYTIGADTETLTGDVIVTWLTGSEGGQISVNRDLAAAYVKTLADKYNTAGKERTLHSASGKDVAVKGSYGWKIDEAGETDALIAAIRTGQSQSKEPVYAQAAATHDGADWGNTYVEVDLGGQHVYMVKDGALVWDAPCVTGNLAKNYGTPTGIYSLTYKQTDRILRGEKKADGTYEYESHVDYWMPFNGGIGLHDAAWRSNFGGSIYKTSGSHGCINLPSAKAKTLYDLVYKGIPVICY